MQVNVDEMHKISMTNSEELSFLRSFHENINKSILGKNTLLERLTEDKKDVSLGLETMTAQYEKL